MVVWVVVAQLMFAGLVEKAFLRRKAWLGQYLEVTSPWHRRLRAGVLIVAWNQLLSLILAPVLLITLRRLDSVELLFLLLTSGAFAICYRWFTQRLKGHVIAEYLPAVTRQLTLLPTSGLLTVTLMMVAIWQPQPYLINIPWINGLRDYLADLPSHTMLGALERISAVFEYSGFWLMQNALHSLSVSSYVAILGWIAMLLLQGTLAWSYIRLLVGIATVLGYIFTETRQAHGLSQSRED